MESSQHQDTELCQGGSRVKSLQRRRQVRRRSRQKSYPRAQGEEGEEGYPGRERQIHEWKDLPLEHMKRFHHPDESKNDGDHIHTQRCTDDKHSGYCPVHDGLGDANTSGGAGWKPVDEALKLPDFLYGTFMQYKQHTGVVNMDFLLTLVGGFGVVLPRIETERPRHMRPLRNIG